MKKSLLQNQSFSINTLLIGFIFLCVSIGPISELFAQNWHEQELESLYFKAEQAYDAALYEQALSLFNQSLSSEEAYKEEALFGKWRTKIALDSSNIGTLTKQFELESTSNQFIKKAYLEWANYSLHQQNDREEYKRHLHKAISYSGLETEQAEWMLMLANNEAARDSMALAHQYLDSVSVQYKNTKWGPEARYQAARWHLQAEQFAESAEDLQKLRKDHPTHELTRSIDIRLGEALYKAGNFEDAITEFKRQLPIMTGDKATKAVYLTAESYNVLNDYDNATTWYLRYQREIDAQQKDSRAADYGLGWIYLKQSIYHWAVNAFQEASVGDDVLAQKATYYKAISEKLSGRYPEALDSFEAFFNRFSEGIWAERVAYEWAVTAFEMGDYPKSIDILLPLARNAASLEDAAPILTFLGEAFFANGEYSSAITAFDEASKNTKLDPRIRLQAEFQKGWVLYRNQAYKEARQNFEAVYRSAISDSIKIEALFWSADCSYQLEDFDRSAAEFRRFVEENPNHQFNGAAIYSLGWAQFMRGEFDAAAENLETFLADYKAPPIAIFPYDTDTRLRIGDSYFALGRYDQAIDYYAKAIGAEPGGDYAMYQIANCYYRAERTAEAIDEFAKLLRIYPYTIFREQAQFNIGYLWFLNGRYDLARSNYQKLIRMVPGSNWAARAQYNIGDAYFNEGEFDSSIVAYQAVLENYPRSDYIIEAANGIQYAQLASGQEDSSNEILQDFIQKNPRASTLDALRYRKAESLFQSGDYENAIKAFEQYLVVTGSNRLKDDALFQIAEAYRFSNRIEIAKTKYQELVDSYPQSELAATALAILGKQAFSAGNYRLSVDYFSALEKKDRRYKNDAQISQAKALVELGNLVDAEKLFTEVLERDPQNASAKVGLGILTLRRGAYEESIALLQPVADTDLSEFGAQALYHIALAQHEQNFYEEALENLAKVSVLFGIYEEWVTRSGLKTVQILLTLNRQGEAADVLNSMQEKYPESQYTKQAESLINQ